MYTPLGKFLQISQGALLNAGLLRGGRITSQELIIAGGTNGVIRSQNFDPTSELGWAVFGDGSASFYGDVFFGENAIFQGDLYSANWNGTIPLDLSGVDTGATAGFALDSSVGSAQFMGNVWIGGDLQLSGGAFRSVANTNNSYIELDPAINNVMFRFFGNPNTLQGVLGLDTGNLVISTDETDVETGNQIRLEAETSIVLFGAHDGTTPTAVIIGSNNLNNPPDTLLKVNADVLGGQGGGFVVQNANSASTPAWAFDSDTDTGMYLSGSNALSIATGGTDRVTISGTRVDLAYSGTDQEILRFNTERAWSFFQRASGASTRLALVSATTSKNFDIEAPSGMFARFFAGSSVSNSFFQAENVLVGAEGNASSPSLRWAATSNTGIFHSSSANQIGFATAGTTRVLIGTGGYANFLVRDNTTGSSSNVFIASSGGNSGVMFRSTSARKYKSHIDYSLDLASIKLKPAKFYREDDDAWYYGFIADDLAEQDPLLGVYEGGEIENYDQRAVMAVMAAKINRLERLLNVA